jgi:hypothetical protein
VSREVQTSGGRDGGGSRAGGSHVGEVIGEVVVDAVEQRVGEEGRRSGVAVQWWRFPSLTAPPGSD